MPVFALAWILRKDIISSVITGASKPSQLAGNIAASGVKLSNDVIEEIDKIFGFVPFERHAG